MKELSEIIDRVSAFGPDEKAVIATVVDLKGSGYRLPGARMLITGDGLTVGTVSGGCLEADVLERARRVIETGKAEIFTYDTTADENSVFSLNMGCRGILRILIEPVGANSEFITRIREVFDTRRPMIAATVIDSPLREVPVGTRVFARHEGSGESVTSSGLHISIPELAYDMRTLAGSSVPMATITYSISGEMIEFAFENLMPPVMLYIFGAGADAVPLAAAAHALGWQAKVHDHRPAFLSAERFGKATELVAVDRDAAPEIHADARTAIVSMNHNYDRDKRVMVPALRSNAFYVGALGPKKRTAQILDELAASGETFSDEQLSRLRAPAGLDIGGDSPESIAVSIIAEIQSVLRHRGGMPLRDREAPIYDRR